MNLFDLRKVHKTMGLGWTDSKRLTSIAILQACFACTVLSAIVELRKVRQVPNRQQLKDIWS